MSFRRTFLLVLAPAVVPLAARSQPEPAEPLPRYNVEIIVFANNEVDPSEERFEREVSETPAGVDGLDALIAVEPFGPASAATEYGDRFGRGELGPGFGDNATRFPPAAPDSGAATPVPVTTADADGPLAFIYPFGRPASASSTELASSNGPAAGDPAPVGAGPPDTVPGGGVPPSTGTARADTTAAPDSVAGSTAAPDTVTGATAAPPAEPPGFRVLGPDELILDDAAAIVRRLGAYRLLGHGGWQQDGLPENAAKSFNIARLGIPNPRGTISLYLGRFLHVRLDLDYRGPWPAIATGNDVGSGAFAGAYPALEPLPLPEHFRLTDERNGIRSGELHYIDHPRFGVLLIVTPAPEPETPAEGTDTLPSA